MAIKTAYQLDATGRYLGPTPVQESPLHKGRWLYPPLVIDDAPPAYDPHDHDAYWVDGQWELRRILTQAERYREGLDPIPDGMTLDGDDIRPMTRAELVAAGLLTQAEADSLTAAEVRTERDMLMRTVVDTYNAARWEDMTEAERQAVRIYRRALKEIPEQAGFPYDIVWPVRPTA